MRERSIAAPVLPAAVHPEHLRRTAERVLAVEQAAFGAAPGPRGNVGEAGGDSFVRLGEAVVELACASPGDVDEEPVEHLPASLVQVKAVPEELAQQAARLRNAHAEGAVQLRQPERSAGVRTRMAHEVADGAEANARHRAVGRAVNQFVELPRAEAVRAPDVCGVGRDHAVALVGEGPAVAGNRCARPCWRLADGEARGRLFEAGWRVHRLRTARHDRRRIEQPQRLRVRTGLQVDAEVPGDGFAVDERPGCGQRELARPAGQVELPATPGDGPAPGEQQAVAMRDSPGRERGQVRSRPQPERDGHIAAVRHAEEEAAVGQRGVLRAKDTEVRFRAHEAIGGALGEGDIGDALVRFGRRVEGEGHHATDHFVGSGIAPGAPVLVARG